MKNSGLIELQPWRDRPAGQGSPLPMVSPPFSMVAEAPAAVFDDTDYEA
jgi:hypothetical protein